MQDTRRQILAVEHRAPALRDLEAVLSSLPSVEVIGVGSVASALSALDRLSPSLLITESQLSDGDALQIIDKIDHLGLSIPVLIRAEGTDAFGGSTKAKHARITMLARSLPLAELCERVASQIEAELEPVARDPFGIVDYLQLAAFSRRSLEFNVELRGIRRGWIRVVEGEVWSACFEQLRGIEAVAALVASAFDNIVVIELGEPGPRELEASLNGLLLEFARLEDEARREADAPLEDDVLDELDALGERPEPARSPAPAADDHHAVRELIASLVGDRPEQATQALAMLGAERVSARTWLRGLAEPEAELPVDARVHLLDFEAGHAAELVAQLERADVAAVALDGHELLERTLRPALVVVWLGLPEEVDDLDAETLARFDLIWALRVGARACPWLAVTDRPTRFRESLCRALGASAWFSREPVDADDDELVLNLAEYVRSAAPARPRPLTALDAALMLVDLEVDAHVEVQAEHGDGALGVVNARLSMATVSEPEHEPLAGVAAAAALSRWTEARVEIHPPQTDVTRNLPRSLSLALAALASVLSGAPNPRTRAAKEYEPMSNLNTVCEAVVDDVPDAIACGVIDLDTGMLMGIHHTVAYFTQSYLDAVAAAAVDMFRGKNVRRVERLLSKHRGQEIKDAFEEIFISSPAVFHFMKLIPEKSAAVVLVTRKSTNQGMGWASLRMAVDDLRAAMP